MTDVAIFGIDTANVDRFMSDVLAPMCLTGKLREDGSIILTDLYGSDPEDVVFELEWHEFDVRLEGQATT